MAELQSASQEKFMMVFSFRSSSGSILNRDLALQEVNICMAFPRGVVYDKSDHENTNSKENTKNDKQRNRNELSGLIIEKNSTF